VLAEADLQAFRALARAEVPVIGPLLRPLSRTADHGLLWFGTAAALAALDGPRGRRAAVRGTASLVASSALANLVGKAATRRARPPLDGFPATRLIRKMPFTSAMPSGHAASAFGFATGASLEAPALALPLGAVATLVAFSRVYIGAHYPSDVLAGAATGVAVGLAGRRVALPAALR